MRFHVTCRELVYVDRTYELEAADGKAAAAKVRSARGGVGELVDEQIQDTARFDGVLRVHDQNGNEVRE